jgi:hypothetical protein
VRATPTSYRKPPLTPRPVISRERRTSPAGTPHSGRDREIYCRYAGGRLRRPALALSGLAATARLVRAAASGHAVAVSRFLGPATRAASRTCSAAGPRNDRSRFHPAGCARRPPRTENLPTTPRTVISRERPTSPAGTPHPGRDREIYCRYAGGQLRRPALALSGLVATARVVRAAASGHAVAESRFLGPATRAASRKCSAAGPRNDRSRFHPAGCARRPPRTENLPTTPRTVISRERRTSPADTPHPGRDREIYCRYAGGQLRRSALALSGLVATGRVVRAAASDHAVTESRFLGPATRVASRKCSAAGPRNDRSRFHPAGCARRPPRTENLPLRRDLSFRGSAAPHRRVPHTRGATEKSIVGMPVAGFGARHWPCPASSRPHVWCGLPRQATQSPRVDFSALQPASRAERAARPGLEMTDRVYIRQGARDAHSYRKPPPYAATCHFEGAPHLTGGYPTLGARPRNLLSVCRWPASAPGTGPVRPRRDRTSGAGCRVRPRSSRE